MLPCGHHESNMVETVESKTKFCRQCDIESRCRDAETREKELFEENRSLRATVSTLTAELIRLAMPVAGDVREAAEAIKADAWKTGLEKFSSEYGPELVEQSMRQAWETSKIPEFIVARAILSSGPVGGKDEGLGEVANYRVMYTTDDDGIHLDSPGREKRISLGFCTVGELIEAAKKSALGITTRPEGR